MGSAGEIDSTPNQYVAALPKFNVFRNSYRETNKAGHLTKPGHGPGTRLMCWGSSYSLWMGMYSRLPCLLISRSARSVERSGSASR